MVVPIGFFSIICSMFAAPILQCGGPSGQINIAYPGLQWSIADDSEPRGRVFSDLGFPLLFSIS